MNLRPVDTINSIVMPSFGYTKLGIIIIILFTAFLYKNGYNFISGLR
jgi:hypothetical protein